MPPPTTLLQATLFDEHAVMHDKTQLHALESCTGLPAYLLNVVVRGCRHVSHLDRVQPPRHSDQRCSIEEPKCDNNRIGGASEEG